MNNYSCIKVMNDFTTNKTISYGGILIDLNRLHLVKLHYKFIKT